MASACCLRAVVRDAQGCFHIKYISFISPFSSFPLFVLSQATVLQVDRRVYSADRAPQERLRSGFQMQKPTTGHRSTHR